MPADENNNHVLDEESLSSWKKKDLVEWLVRHKKKKSGKKQVLINRILRTLRFDESSGSDSDSEYSDSGISTDIPNINCTSLSSTWEPITTKLCPPIRDEDVENYFLFNKNPLSGKTQGCHRQLKKARKFCREHFIFDMECNEINNQSPYFYVKANCKPSMRDIVFVSDGKMARNYSLHVILVKKTGKIESGQCNCKPGSTGLCSHVGGLLLTLVQIKNACTSKGCEWLKPQTALQVQPQRLKDITFSSMQDAPQKPYPDTYQAGPCKDPVTFLEDIMTKLGEVNPECVLHKTLNPNITDVSHVLAKYEPPFTYHDSVNINSTVCQSEFRTFAMGIELDQSDIDKVKESTKGQSSNPLWKEIRTNLITASNFGAVCKKRPETQPENLLARLRGYNGDVDSKALSYGRRKESLARRDYAKRHLQTCGDVTVQTTGLVISKEFPFLGASVDGIVKCAKCGVGALEIKCPYVGRNATTEEWSSMKTSYVNRTEDGMLQLKHNHNYMYQVMGQMNVLGVEWCDFVIWTKKGFNVERIKRNSEFWFKMLFELKFFYNSFFLGEKFTNRVKRGKKLL